jgi:hypothetical protein
MYGAVCFAIDSYCASPDELAEMRKRMRKAGSSLDVYFNPCQQCFGKNCATCADNAPRMGSVDD